MKLPVDLTAPQRKLVEKMFKSVQKGDLMVAQALVKQLGESFAAKKAKKLKKDNYWKMWKGWTKDGHVFYITARSLAEAEGKADRYGYKYESISEQSE